ncbi:hypothetical protein F5X96DRAFT_534692 [Biscogniauxia mediterranea]|nr:hypothetical protein F5X96DRAFT_534692 [Biscogniauxia mediterranea]
MQRSGTLIGCILQIVGQSALTDRGVAEESDGWRHTTRLQDPTICKMNGAVQPVFCLRIPWFVFPLEGLSSPPSRCFAITLPQAAERGLSRGLPNWPSRVAAKVFRHKVRRSMSLAIPEGRRSSGWHGSLDMYPRRVRGVGSSDRKQYQRPMWQLAHAECFHLVACSSEGNREASI